MRLGILQTGRAPDELQGKHGDYPAMFERLLDGHGLQFQHFAVLDNQLPESVQTCDAWLITGSRFAVYESHSWLLPLTEFVRTAYAEAVPLLGICFGHQLLAQVLGGDVGKYPGGWGVGRHIYAREAPDRSLALMAMHQDQVLRAPETADVLASSEFCPYAVLQYGSTALSYQAHPEFSRAYTHALIELRRNLIPDPVVAAALAAIDGPVDSEQVAEHLVTFLQQATLPS